MSHKYIPNQEIDHNEMLSSIEKNSIEDMLKALPEEILLKKDLNLPAQLTEIELEKKLCKLANENASTTNYISFLGAGNYDHYVPSVIDAIVSREEFYTAYTPYQPEISQGTLQSIFEYQTAMCKLTEMDISNASMYDGASALLEACSLAVSHTRISRVLLPKNLHPDYISVVKTGLYAKNVIIDQLPYTQSLEIDLLALRQMLEENTYAAIVIASPNYFGVIEDIKSIKENITNNKTLLITCVDPISLGILTPPGKLGADIVVGDGQSLGSYQNFGGPHFGFFCTTKKLMRKIPGRIVGQTTDVNGNRAFVLTLQAREQHIRREKAQSNICSNHALNALRALIYLCITGKEGLYKIAIDCANKACYLKEQLIKTGYFTVSSNSSTFKEFTVESNISLKILNDKLLTKGYLGGFIIKNLNNQEKWLLAVTEKRSYEEIDSFVEEVKAICKENL